MKWEYNGVVFKDHKQVKALLELGESPDRAIREIVSKLPNPGSFRVYMTQPTRERSRCIVYEVKDGLWRRIPRVGAPMGNWHDEHGDLYADQNGVAFDPHKANARAIMAQPATAIEVEHAKTIEYVLLVMRHSGTVSGYINEDYTITHQIDRARTFGTRQDAEGFKRWVCDPERDGPGDGSIVYKPEEIIIGTLQTTLIYTKEDSHAEQR